MPFCAFEMPPLCTMRLTAAVASLEPYNAVQQRLVLAVICTTQVLLDRVWATSRPLDGAGL